MGMERHQQGRKHLNLIPLTISWVMWNKRNKRAPKGKEEDLVRIRDRYSGVEFFGNEASYSFY